MSKPQSKTKERFRPMTLQELRALPTAFDITTAGRGFGIGRTKAYELAKRGEFPCRVLQIGPAYRVTRTDLLRALGVLDTEAVADPASTSDTAA